jgi:hypothetical protein
MNAKFKGKSTEEIQFALNEIINMRMPAGKGFTPTLAITVEI